MDNQDNRQREPGRRYFTRPVSVSSTGEPQAQSGNGHRSNGMQESSKTKDKFQDIFRTTTKTKPAKDRQSRSLVLKRSVNNNARRQRREQKLIKKGHTARLLVALVVLVCLAVIVWAFWDTLPLVKNYPGSLLTNSRADEPTNKTTRRSSLDETRPSLVEIESYKVAAQDPRLLIIDKLDIRARVKRVGTTLDQKPISPSNIHDVGWYEGSDSVGRPGVSLINGHISGKTKDGVFSNLSQIGQGDKISIEMGDGKLYSYTVVRTQSFTGGSLDTALLLQPVDPAKNGLTLVTSTANYEKVVPKSSKGIAVFATQD